MATKKKTDAEKIMEIDSSELDGLKQTADATQQTADTALQNYIDGANTYKYNMNDDPLFASLKTSYQKNAQKNAQKASAMAATRTGGYGNSYGATAAAGSYNDTMENLYDVVPTLEQNAYARYRDNLGDQRDIYVLQQGRADSSKNEYNTRENTLYARSETQDETAYNRAWSEDERTYNREWNEDERKYEREQQEYQNKLAEAQLMMDAGDYSLIGNLLNIDVTRLQNDYDLQQKIDRALKTGDLSELKDAGIDITRLEYTFDADRINAENNMKIQQNAQAIDVLSTQLSAALQAKNYTKAAEIMNRMNSYITKGGGGKDEGVTFEASDVVTASAAKSASKKKRRAQAKVPAEAELTEAEKKLDKVTRAASTSTSKVGLKAYLNQQVKEGNIEKEDADTVYDLLEGRLPKYDQEEALR